MNSEEVREVFEGEKLMPSVMANQLLEALKQSEEAAYKVYLVLATHFGAGQKLLS
jgi:hypothetical protein